ncbi:MAG: hypothetical protein IJQ60_04515 [Prevotella sp.]|nr:hypothetical protein [Prevotella sp.]MBR0263128.1 hypothetical protein [Prevotella sp.]
MKKMTLFLAAFFAALFVNAQTDIDLSNLFTIQNGDDGKPQPIELNDPCTAKEGIIFIGDTRPADKIQDNKYRGMRVTKSRRHFTVDGAVRQYQTSLAFRRAPQGVSKDHVVDVTLVPRSCMIQVKPTSDGKLTLCGQTNKPEGNNIYVAVRNGDDFKNIATLKFTKDEEVKGNKATPYQPQSLDYKYAEGDELWIYSDGSINLYGFVFTGNIDKSFTGSEPLAVAKAVSKARK